MSNLHIEGGEVWVEDFVGWMYGGNKMVKGKIVAENKHEYIVQYSNPAIDPKDPLRTLYITKPFPKSKVYKEQP